MSLSLPVPVSSSSVALDSDAEGVRCIWFLWEYNFSSMVSSSESLDRQTGSGYFLTRGFVVEVGNIAGYMSVRGKSYLSD